jgi:hypothetical protein
MSLIGRVRIRIFFVRVADPDPDPYQNVTYWQGAEIREHEGAAGLEALVRDADPAP